MPCTGVLKNIVIRFTVNPSTGTQETWLNGNNVEEKIRGIEVSEVVSKISQIGEVREKMVHIQRKIGMTVGWLWMAGISDQRFFLQQR